VTDFDSMCFVITPFGKKAVYHEGGQVSQIDYDVIYETVFEPAVALSRFPDGRQMLARRVDRGFVTGEISEGTFACLEYARLVLADISGFNVNACYELGVRHRARPWDTVIVRQSVAPVPFDIKQIKVIAYDYAPASPVDDCRLLVTKLIEQTLAEEAPHVPVRRALSAQRGHPAEALLCAAERALRSADLSEAARYYEEASRAMPQHPMVKLKLGLLHKDHGDFERALQLFSSALQDDPEYAPAWRERGIAENLMGIGGGAALAEAIRLDPQDFDAFASLGGALTQEKRYEEALSVYRRATEVSRGHPHPLLNALKLEARLHGHLKIDAARRFQLQLAERGLRAQVAGTPPSCAPWSFFDLAECRLYDNDVQGFLDNLQAGCESASAAWQAETFRDSLQFLIEGRVDFDGLGQGLQLLDVLIPHLPD
jgi:tetratricopeptide (TPR) repeat protein